MAESEGEGFLARWSRRKRGADTAARRPPAPKLAAAPPDSERSDLGPAAAPPAVDPAMLPPVETIAADSDITAFLAPGVPAELTRAALRRAWASDPAIRDFIGLSENAWDFTAADGIPGFGPLSAEDARRLFEQLTGEAKSAADEDPTPQPAADAPPQSEAAAEQRPNSRGDRERGGGPPSG